MSKKQRKKELSGPPLLSLEEETHLRSLLGEPSRIDLSHVKGQVDNPRLAKALLEGLSLETPGVVPLLSALKRAFPEKEVQKAAKKFIFRLKQRGIPVEEGEKEPSLFRPEQDEPSPDTKAYLGLIDGFGNRAVFLTVSRGLSGVDVGMGVLSDEKGVLDFVHGRYGKKRLRELKDLFFEKVPNMVETSLAHAVTVLEAAYGAGPSGPSASAGSYLRLRPWLIANVPLLSRPPAYDLIPPESPSEGFLAEPHMEKLLSHDWMQSWIIDAETISPLVEAVVKVEESPIVISGGQKTTRIHQLKEDHLPRIYPDPQRVRILNRLEEMAYLFLKAGQEAHARTALSAASSLKEKDSSLRANPFLMFMIDRNLNYYLNSSDGREKPKGRGDSSSGLILPA